MSVSTSYCKAQVPLAQVCPCHVIRVAAVEKAEAEKIAVVKAAEGDAESKYLQGQVSTPDHLVCPVQFTGAVISEVFASCEFGLLC